MSLYLKGTFGAIVYFLPALLAMLTNRRSTGWIMLLNALLGWTIIGWIAALVWAIRSGPHE